MSWSRSAAGWALAVMVGVGCGPRPSTEVPEAEGTHEREQESMEEQNPDTPTVSEDDPWLWLEEVQAEEALDWARAQNEATFSVLKTDPRFATIEAEALEILTAEDRIPYGSVRKGFVYNFWRDSDHIRGIWRRIPLDAYLAGEDTWQTLIDLDALAEEEGENWVYHGISCLPPDFNRCIVDLSRDGKDASVQREFDLETLSFVEGGFALTEAKSSMGWVDKDTMLVSTDFGEGSMTTSGYPRIIKVWERGTSLEEARTVLEIDAEDMGAWPWISDGPEGLTVMLGRYKSFYASEYHLLGDDLKTRTRLPIPESASVRGLFANRHLVLMLRDAWEVGGESYPQGALLSVDIEPYRGGSDAEPTVEAIYVPDERSSVRSVSVAKGRLLVSLLVDVKSRVLQVTRGDAGWETAPFELPAEVGVASLVSVSDYEENFFVVYEDPKTPESLYYWRADEDRLEKVRSIPARFDAEGMRVEQRHATSADGTRVPYFVMFPAGFKEGEPRPTYLYGYGGFEVSMLPYYRPITGRFWVEQGGVYVLANIRGGGEYGPRWHQAALKTDRQRAYDDFHAVAEDLIAQGITTREQLGIHGGSNGGLLVGVAFTQRPELYQAVICEVPLLDMMRYHTLLAGASWMAEYGDPDVPEEREVLLSYSPYQNVRADESYPRVFFTTSTADDRVHPGHARKMAARMLEQGHEIYYFENIEGGHGGVTNHQQQAMKTGLKFVYLMRELGLE